MAQLIHDPNGPGEQRYPLRPGINTLGRSRDNSIVIPDSVISRRHAEVELRGRRAFLTDLDSSNHCYVNGALVTHAELADGDEVCFGDICLIYVAADDDKDLESTRVEVWRGPIPGGNVAPERGEAPGPLLVPETSAVDEGGRAGRPSLLRLPDDAGGDREVAKLRALLRASNRLSATTAVQDVIEQALAQLLELVGVDRAAVLMRDLDTGELERCTVRARAGLAADDAFAGRDIAESALVKGGPVLTAEVPGGIRSQGEGGESLHVALCLPLATADSVIGALCVDNLALPAVYSEEETDYLVALAEQIALAIDRAAQVEARVQQARDGGA